MRLDGVYRIIPASFGTAVVVKSGEYLACCLVAAKVRSKAYMR
jgi:hypothetical protein